MAYGTAEERAHFQINGAGYGVRWPDLGEDIGIEGLVLGKISTESQPLISGCFKGVSKKSNSPSNKRLQADRLRSG